MSETPSEKIANLMRGGSLLASPTTPKNTQSDLNSEKTLSKIPESISKENESQASSKNTEKLTTEKCPKPSLVEAPSVAVLNALKTQTPKEPPSKPSIAPEHTIVQSVALGNLTVRQQFYKTYRSLRGTSLEMNEFLCGCGARDTYLYLSRKWQDDEPHSPIMLGMSAYRTKESMTTLEAEQLNPYPENEEYDNHIEWFAGFHHARRTSKDRLPGDEI
jgi:hypothetical protein